MQKLKCLALATLGLSISLASCAKTEQTSTLKQQLEKQGYNFVKQIDAPEGLIGWSGFKDEYPSTVFISKDQKYYIVGDLFNAQNTNLTEEAINTHVKGAVLEQIWKSLEQTTWIQDGKKDAPKIVYVFTDVNCPYCHSFWQKARPWVDSGKVQLRHIMVGVIRENSKAQAATILSSNNPEEIFKQFNLNNGKNKIKDMTNIPKILSDKLDNNAETMEKYGFYATPAIVWKNAKGEIESQQGMPKDLQAILD
ncbi:thiol:disulfide interchange protein DsbG [Acinetobacter rudis]|uniref:Thiol:disulfide interchange protein n=1 Tax=Acinetobacter rudis TaxID=632955 RepID=A0AAW8JF66_9GAMM|nr:thiol:disulfide interchange protein DsbG [Acinetobacter rudis]MDQ8936339.1 thiol:disulfide interchange protein DsbG [Acinetobacter rudis]MDQ8953437.1 thiol:disulfide interchange protein DsbG [Acinetobacter rudis]MDQ9018600.1 thiol:disulfide interchange protein DsbG [Acinetobacter rudis]